MRLIKCYRQRPAGDDFCRPLAALNKLAKYSSNANSGQRPAEEDTGEDARAMYHQALISSSAEL